MLPQYTRAMERRRQAPNLAALLRRAQALVEDDLLRRVRERGVPDAQPTWHHVFFTIDPEGSRLTTLAARASMTLPAMWEIVQDLEARGYVERRPDPADRRAKLICLTEAGRAAVRQGRRAARELEAEYRRRVGEERFGQMRAGLAALLVEQRGDADA